MIPIFVFRKWRDTEQFTILNWTLQQDTIYIIGSIQDTCQRSWPDDTISKRTSPCVFNIQILLSFLIEWFQVNKQNDFQFYFI